MKNKTLTQEILKAFFGKSEKQFKRDIISLELTPPTIIKLINLTLTKQRDNFEKLIDEWLISWLNDNLLRKDLKEGLKELIPTLKKKLNKEKS